MSLPYPGYPPTYQVVDKVDGLRRTCIVIDLLSLGQLSNSEMAMIQEQLEACAEKLQSTLTSLKVAQVVTPNRFDPILKTGLRLPPNS